MAMTSEQELLARSVKAELGYPVLCVELEPEDQDPSQPSPLEAVITDAELWILVHFAPVLQGTMTLTSGQSEYDVEADVGMVVEMAFPQDTSMFGFSASEEDFFGPVPWQYWGGGLSHMPASGLMQLLSYYETLRRVLSNEAMWWYDSITRKLQIRPSTLSGTAYYWYTTNVLDYSKLDPVKMYLLRRYAVARAKMVLGNIRSKFGDQIPTASGMMSMNGGELVSQAQEELQILDEKIKLLAVPMPFTLG